MKDYRLTIDMYFEAYPPIRLTVNCPEEVALRLQGRKLKTVQVALEKKSAIGNLKLDDIKELPHGG